MSSERNVPEAIQLMAEQALKLVYSKGLLPMAATIEVVSVHRLSKEDIAYAVRQAVSNLVCDEMTRSRSRQNSSDCDEPVTAHATFDMPVSSRNSPMPTRDSIKAMTEKVYSALDRYYEGADGVERSLLKFTIADHRYRLVIEQSIEKGAKARGAFHEKTIAALQKHKVDSIEELPKSVQRKLEEMLP